MTEPKTTDQCQEFQQNEANKLMDFRRGCLVGEGRQIRNIEENPALAQEIERRVDVGFLVHSPEVVLLTPVQTSHSIFRDRTFHRGIFHNRSFTRELQGKDGRKYTLIVKGGDLHYSEGVTQGLSRIKNHQIPGGCLEKANTEEYDAAVAIQELALKTLGRPTYTAYPIDIREIQRVPTRANGTLIDVKSFMNSPEYAELLDQLRDAWRIPKGISLGDLLLDKYGLRPTEYLYVVEGLNIRSNELPSLLFFIEANSYLGEDRIAHYQTGLFKYGVIMASEGKSHDETIRAVYATLARTYGINLNGILPDEPITKANYIQTLKTIREVCESKGIAGSVLDRYIDRICEVAALGHSAGCTFSPKDEKTGGSLISRNVTYNGVVLDLDTFRRIDLSDIKYVTKDFGELLLSVACMRRLVSSNTPPDFYSKIAQTYINKIRQFTHDPTLIATIEKAIQFDQLSEDIVDCL